MTDRDDKTDDELLSAYVDGELAPREADRMSERLAADPRLARRLEQLRMADRSVRRAFTAVDDMPLPQGVLDLLEENDAGSANERAAENVVAMPQRTPRRFLQMPVAIAASVALVAGFLVNEFFEREPGRESAMRVSGAIAADSDLHRFLETGLSAKPEALADGSDGRIVLTFQASDGDWCRQFRLGADDGAMQGLACRRAGSWQMETVSFDAAGPSDGPYRQAAGTTPVSLTSAVRDRLGNGEPLQPEDESQVISSGWK